MREKANLGYFEGGRQISTNRPNLAAWAHGSYDLGYFEGGRQILTNRLNLAAWAHGSCYLGYFEDSIAEV